MESLIDSQPFDWEELGKHNTNRTLFDFLYELDARIQKFDNRDIVTVGQLVTASQDHT